MDEQIILTGSSLNQMHFPQDCVFFEVADKWYMGTLSYLKSASG